MLLRIRHPRPSIRKEHSEPIAWHNQDANIDLPSFDRAPKMDHVNNKKIAPRRHLNLNA